MATVVALGSVGADEIENLLNDAFGADRHKRTAYLLRQGVPLIDHLSFGILGNAELIGSIQCWPIAVSNTPLILVGPVAVATNRQNQGLGHDLMHRMLAAIRPDDPPMLMIGDPEYYDRFGFVAEGTGGWTLPGPWEARRLLLRNTKAMTLPEQGMVGPRHGL